MILVIGAGPAGLAAARAAALSGDDVAIIDSAHKAGGQYWRHRDSVTGYKSDRSREYLDAITERENITFISGASVWSALKDGDLYQINYLQSGVESSLRVEKIIVATGAYDRTIPFDGWDQPGVMTAGAAQALLKGHGVLAGKKVVIAGSGPFLLPVATGLAEAGAEIVALCEANSPLRWLQSPLALIANPSKLVELVYYASKIRAYAIPIKFGYRVRKFTNGKAELIKGSRRVVVECDVVASGFGFTPDVTVGGILGCEQEVANDGSVHFSVDQQQRSSQHNIWIAGEATGIGGADLSLIEGEIAGLSATSQRIPLSLKFKRDCKRAFARALMRSYPVPRDWLTEVSSSTCICRCEEVSLGEIRKSVEALKADDVRGSKLFTRAGMGLCQGRVCARYVAEVVSSISGSEISDASRIAYSNRPIASPISLGQLGDGISNN
jgi:NADPH-dependent 2,4-dienoyl-CoA reductase/sulfur reductase-like enzyme